MDLKLLETKTSKLHHAVARYNDLVEREHKSDGQLLVMIHELIADVNDEAAKITQTVRITPEQVDADTNLLTKLEASVNAWAAELELIEKELIDQALIDAKEGAKSNRYLTLEKRESDLKKLIAEGEEKLGRVSGRMISPGFGNTVQQIVNNAKPQ